jgi:hypothetical protein
VQGELQVSKRVLHACVLGLFIIVDVVDFQSENVVFLKIVLDRNLSHPLRRQVIVNNLGLADFLPDIILLH